MAFPVIIVETSGDDVAATVIASGDDCEEDDAAAAAAVIIGVAYVLAPGTPAIGYNGAPVTDQTLKLTDTILNLTYFALGASALAILGSIVWGAVKGK